MYSSPNQYQESTNTPKEPLNPQPLRLQALQRPIRIQPPLDLQKPLQLRITRPEHLRLHPRVLRQVQPPAVGQHDLIQLVQEGKHPVRHRKVQRECIALHRKTHHPLLLAEVLQHRQEGRHLLIADLLQNPHEAIVGIVRGDDELVLGEALLAIDAVPVEDAVEGVEIGIVVGEVGEAVAVAFGVKDVVEGAGREGVDGEGGKKVRQGELAFAHDLQGLGFLRLRAFVVLRHWKKQAILKGILHVLTLN